MNYKKQLMKIPLLVLAFIAWAGVSWGQCTNTYAAQLPATTQTPGTSFTTNTGKYFAINVTAGTTYKITSSLAGSAFNIRMGGAANPVIWVGYNGSHFTAPSTGVAYVHHSTSACATTTNTTARTINFVTQSCPTTLPWVENFNAMGSIGTELYPCGWTKTHGDWRSSNAATTTYCAPRSTPNYLTISWTATNEVM